MKNTILKVLGGAVLLFFGTFASVIGDQVGKARAKQTEVKYNTVQDKVIADMVEVMNTAEMPDQVHSFGVYAKGNTINTYYNIKSDYVVKLSKDEIMNMLGEDIGKIASKYSINFRYSYTHDSYNDNFVIKINHKDW